MGCKITVKVHPEGSETKLSPYTRFLKSLESPRIFTHKKLRGDMTRTIKVHPQRHFSQSVHTPPSRGSLFIGINKYPHWEHLDSATNDASSLADIFMNMGYNTTLLLDEKASLSNIQNELEKCERMFDVFVVGFFGHGIYVPGIGGMFATYDSKKNEDAFDKLHASHLRTMSVRSNATSGLFILDFCYSGSFLIDETKKRGSWQEKLSCEKSRMVLTSGLHNQRVDDGETHSPFTSALINNLKNNKENQQRSVIELYINIRTSLMSSSTLSVPKLGRFPGDGGGDIFLKTT